MFAEFSGQLNLDAVSDLSATTRSIETRFSDKLGPQTATLGPVVVTQRPITSQGQSATHEHGPLRIGNLLVCADARIDARQDLISQLRLADRQLDVGALSDAELILHAYRLWGKECLNLLIGDFAFVIWDHCERELFCARDHLGVRPFYYAVVHRRMLFGNSLRSLITSNNIDQARNEYAIADMLIYGSNQDDNTTFYESVERLPPGHYLHVNSGTLSMHRYWNLQVDIEAHHRDWRNDIAEFDQLLGISVKERLRTKHPAISLSGGMDSSSIAVHIQDQLKEDQLDAFTMALKTQPDQERRYAVMVAEHVGIPIHFLFLDQYPYFSKGLEYARLLPQPADLSLWHFFDDGRRTIEHGHSMIFSGHGGDIILHPSPWYIGWLLREQRFGTLLRQSALSILLQKRLPPLFLRYRLTNRLTKATNAQITFPKWLRTDFIRRLDLNDRIRQSPGRNSTNKHPFRHGSISSLEQPETANLLEVAHPLFTGTGIGYVYPFLDIRLAKYTLGLPPVPWCVSKFILRKSMHRRLPQPILKRPKTILGIDTHFDTLFRPGNEELITTSMLHLAPYIDTDLFYEHLNRLRQDDTLSRNMALLTLSLGAWLSYH